MLGTILRNSKEIAFYSLIGYFLTTTFSHFLAQITYASALLFTIITLFGDSTWSHRLRLNLFYALILLFVGWSILSALVGSTPLASILILKEEWLFLMIPTVAYVADSERKIDTLLKTLVISASLVALFGILQYYIAPLIYHGNSLSPTPSGHYRTSGGFSHYLTFGDYFAIAATLLFSVAPYLENKKWKLLSYAAFILTALATILTYSYGPIMAMVFGVIISILFFGRYHRIASIIAIACIALAAILLAPKIQSKLKHTVEVEWTGKYDGSRLAIWRAAGRMIEKYPVFGVGQGNFDNLYLQYCDTGNTRKFSHAHNDFLNIAAYAGIPAAIFFFGFWCIIIARMLKVIWNKSASGLKRGVATAVLPATLVFFFTSLYEASFADEEVRLFLMAIWGLFLAAESIIKMSAQTAEEIEKA